MRSANRRRRGRPSHASTQCSNSEHISAHHKLAHLTQPTNVARSTQTSGHHVRYRTTTIVSYAVVEHLRRFRRQAHDRTLVPRNFLHGEGRTSNTSTKSSNSEHISVHHNPAHQAHLTTSVAARRRQRIMFVTAQRQPFRMSSSALTALSVTRIRKKYGRTLVPLKEGPLTGSEEKGTSGCR